MADHYVKLWASILDSSVWREPESHRIVWITMLAMADKHGFVGASVDGLARRANVTEEQANQALKSFLAPDSRSRNKDNDGRRIQEVPRGWHILNHGYFRDLQDREMQREYERSRKSEQRARAKSVQASPGHVPDSPGHSSECPPASSDADADAAPSEGESAERGVDAKQDVLPKKKPKLVADRPDDVSKEVWDDWIAYRRSKKAPFSESALKAMRREAEKDDLKLQDAIQATMSAGWQGFIAGRRSSNRGAPRPSEGHGFIGVVPKVIPPGYYDDGLDENGDPIPSKERT